MARIRTVKPQFWEDEDMSTLPYEVRLLAIALLNFSDDKGYFKAHPALVKSFAFPFDEDSTNIRRMLEQLSEIGYLRLFTGSDMKQYGQITNFCKHQKIDRASESKISSVDPVVIGCSDMLNKDSAKVRRTLDSGIRNKEKEGNKEKEIKEHTAHSRFDEFWSEYPKKTDKKKASAKFIKLNPDERLHQRIMAGLRAQKLWRENAPSAEFIPEWKNPLTWLNGENWEDEIKPYKSQPNKPVTGMAALLELAESGEYHQ